jgi:hypothetical protein
MRTAKERAGCVHRPASDARLQWAGLCGAPANSAPPSNFTSAAVVLPRGAAQCAGRPEEPPSSRRFQKVCLSSAWALHRRAEVVYFFVFSGPRLSGDKPQNRAFSPKRMLCALFWMVFSGLI